LSYNYTDLLNKTYQNYIDGHLSGIGSRDPDYTLPPDSIIGWFLKNRNSKIKSTNQVADSDEDLLCNISLQVLLSQCLHGRTATILIKLFNRIMANRQDQWAAILEISLKHMNLAISDREMLLQKFNYVIGEETVMQLMDNNDISETNLSKHKMYLKLLIGKVFQKDTEQTKIELEKKHLEKTIRALIVDWDIISNAKTLNVLK